MSAPSEQSRRRTTRKASPQQPIINSAQPPNQTTGRNPGCWLAGALTILLASGLVAAGLFLPPFNVGDDLLGTNYTQLDANNNAVAVMRVIEDSDASGTVTALSEPAFTLSVDPEDAGEAFSVALNEITTEEFESGSRRVVSWLPDARANLPAHLSLQDSLYAIDATGIAPETVFLTFDAEPALTNPDRIDLFAWHASQNTWQFVPSRINRDGTQVTARLSEPVQAVGLFEASSRTPQVLTVLNFNQELNAEVATLSDIVAPTGMQPALPTTPQRTLFGNLAPGFDSSSGYDVMPVVRNFADPRVTDTETVVSIIANADLRTEHIQQLTSFSVAGGYDGILIDYRDIPAESRLQFTRFIQELNISLDTIGVDLGVFVPSPQNVDGTWETGAYDWQAIGTASDHVLVNSGLNPADFAPGRDRFVEAMLRWAVGEVDRQKLIVELAALSIRETDDGYSRIGYDEALSAVGDVSVDFESDDQVLAPGSEIRIRLDGFDALPGSDEIINTPFLDYFNDDGSLASRMWLTTGEALHYRLDKLESFGLHGVAFDDLTSTGIADGVIENIIAYKDDVEPLVADSQLRLQWRIEGSEGSIQEFTTGFNDEITVTLEDVPQGNYAVNVEVVGGAESASPRDGASIALFAPTTTPTPLPTLTPTRVPSATPTLQPVQPETAYGVTPIAGILGNPIPPGAGTISLEGFEIGGHVTNTGSDRAARAMNDAGMTWMKVQIRYGPGSSTGDAGQAISQARSRGFKILLGIVGDPGDVARGGADYIRGYAGFVADVAALGPDAIEVWNEPNLAREWPEGQISGGNYTALLAASYVAIKERNPNVIVISGAPAPTGAEQSFPGLVVNDDRFLNQMVAAGALNYMDCLGVHYNEGLVTGSATTGDPRGDNYYTRYLPLLIDRYRTLTGGQRPMCITELGYLTPEGYGSLPGAFAWAQNMTVQAQAAYLVDAAAYASRSGIVRLMIVWNIDFERYDSDPMAGYAIIRRDGSCPACTALAAAR